MPTAKQIATRRANARLSHGPKTVAGKAASAINAIKFGFAAQRNLVPGESADQWQEFHDRFIEELLPAGVEETHFAERVVHFAWRMRRFPVVEAETLSAHILEIRQDETRNVPVIWTDSSGLNVVGNRDPEPAAELPPVANELGRAFIRDCYTGRAISQMSRHDAATERAFYSALNALRRLQERRNRPGEPAENLQLQNDLTEGLKANAVAA